MVRHLPTLSIAMSVTSLALILAQPASAETVTLGIGTQDTTTNTVTAGTVVRQLHLLEKYLPTSGKYANIKFEIEWQNFTSGPPVTNAMMANKLQIGMMGDYPLIVNGFTFESNPESKSRLIAVAAYSLAGSGNGIVVHKDSPYYDLADLKGKLVSVPFGSAAHGMVLKAMQDRGYPDDFFQLVSQSPEVGSTNLQEKKIDAHADFVPFAELLPFRGFARKIFDGVETNLPTFHGVVVRTDFAEKYPEVVVAYEKALIAANAWLRADPKLAAEKIQEWTGINKEVVYIFLGPGGNMTTDPTIKPTLIDAAAADVKVLQKLGRMKEFDPKKWVDDSYIRKAYAEMKLDYDAQLASTKNYEITGEDAFCKKPITDPRKAGEVWVDDAGILPFSSTACALGAYADFKAKGKKINVAYVFDTIRGIKLFADQAFFAVGNGEIAPFLLKKDAEAYAAKIDGKVFGFDDAVKAAVSGGKT
ncbi:ABC transporter substrate-binding protein [Bradyrhizobium arachidis]|uniref:ABC transporter substrate-binding protein n=1 Tax=Bradyrhizobium TaxID=374 RepID=UPI00188A36F0|nr:MULTISPECIES: ABC transporter substrate-binding protein [Bradyrhizobium]MDN4983131.1 ABC transporter substrate-binding protein [Bradyrhizobium sp. WYCCWR 13022]UVO34622.1 ABC transporter substrate-binding protein [Bradyrhizobium arachidis]